MPLYRSGKKTILFMHVPKTGGTSIEQALVAHGAVQALKSPRGVGISRREKLSRLSFQHLHYDLLQQVVPREFYDHSLVVVRHPLHRVVSSYRWNTRNLKRPPSFDRWFLLCIWKHRRRRYYADNHMRPQSDFIGPGMEIFRFEDGLEAPVRAACDWLGLAWRSEHLAHEKRTSASRPVRVLDDTMDRIRRFYARDFVQFGYDATALPKGQLEVVDGRHPLSFFVGG